MNIFLSFTILFIISSSGIKDIEQVKELYNEGRFNDARIKLEKITPNHKIDDEVLLYKGLLEEDAEKSLSFYKKIIFDYPKSVFCIDAIYYISQYEFLKGSYEKVITSLRKITSFFPESKYYGLSCFWTASSYEAVGNTTQAILWYKKIEKKDSTVFFLANKALARLSQVKSIYCIQIGSFKNKESAKDLVFSFNKKGYETWLAATRKNGIKYYKVLIGEFDSKEKAKGFSKLFSEKEKIPFWIVKIKKL
ncbi:SPOR domain-containing protein [candidate division WOR-3 bacterium]|nr:SPOR domain-containing protein [candidate division WOR-3 bacterium]